MKNKDTEQAQPLRTASSDGQSGGAETAARLPEERTQPAISAGLTVASLSDMGRSRQYQQDFVIYHLPPEPKQMAEKGALYIVADGMGGHQAGDVASQGAARHVISQYYADMTQDIGTCLVRAIRSANRLIYDQSLANPAYKGMGTTMVAAVIIGRKVHVASVGDSRAYIVDPRTIRQITEDHSWVGEQLRAGLLSPEEARVHPQRNVVTRAIGSKPSVEVDLFEGEMEDHDILFLCTDGVTGHLEDQEIAALVRAYPAEEAARRMVDLANERGGHDNMSILLVSGPKAVASARPTVAAPLPVAPTPSTRQQRRPPFVLLGLGVGAVALVLLMGALLLRPWESDQATATTAATASATLAPATEILIPVTTAPSVEALEPQSSPMTGTTVTPVTTPNPTVDLAAPTSTLAVAPPSNTPVALTPTRAATRARATQTSTFTPTPPQKEYAAPQLVSPEEGVTLQGVERFEWQPLQLGPGDYYDLRFWLKAELDANPNAPGQGGNRPSDTAYQTIDVRILPPVQKYGEATYYWAVVVVHQQGPEDYRVVGKWSERRWFQYTPPTPTPEATKAE